MTLVRTSDGDLRTQIKDAYTRRDRDVPDADEGVSPISITVDDSCCIEGA